MKENRFLFLTNEAPLWLLVITSKQISYFAVIDILDAGIDHIIDVLYLLAQQFVVAGVSEPIGDLCVDHLDLLNYRMLQLPNFRWNDGIKAGHYWVVVEDGFLFEVLHLWRDFRDGVLSELDGPDELGDIGPGRLAGGAIDEA